jgi:hypothetical protein
MFGRHPRGADVASAPFKRVVYRADVPRMPNRRYRVGAVVLGGIAVWLLGGSIVVLVDAAGGTTGDTAREVALLFGLVGLLLSTAAGIAARGLWRAAAKN